jgi:GIY-YIG catalytic domain
MTAEASYPRARGSNINQRGESRMVTIYAMECAATGQAYVGCTAGKIGKRMREHSCLLRAGKHSPQLQMVWNEHAASFQMKPLEVLPDDCAVIEKRERELTWLKHYRAQGLLLNEAVISFQPPPGHAKKAAATRKANGNRHITPESNAKRRLAQLGKPKPRREKLLMR